MNARFVGVLLLLTGAGCGPATTTDAGTGGGAGGGTVSGGGAGGGGATGGSGGGATGGGSGGGAVGGGGGGAEAAFDAGAPRYFLLDQGLFDDWPGTGLEVLPSGELVIAHRAEPGADAGVLVGTFRGVADGGFDYVMGIVADHSGGGAGDLLKLASFGETLHLLSRTGSADNFQLIYAQRVNGVWTQEFPVPGLRVGNPAYGLAIAGDGTVHIAYQLTNFLAADGGSTVAFAHSQRDGAGGWQTTNLGVTANTGTQRTLARSLALTVLPSGEPMIAYETDSQLDDAGVGLYDIRAKVRSGGTFTEEVIAAGNRSSNTPNSLALTASADGRVFVAYRKDGPTNMGSLETGLRVMTRSAAGAWGRGPIALDGDPQIGSYFAAQRYAFRTAPDGVVWLVQDTPFLLHRLSATPTQLEVPNPISGSGFEFGRYPALGFTATGNPQLLARWRDTNNGGRRLYYVRYE